MRRILLAVTVLAATPAYAGNDMFAVTPSGRTEMFLPGTTLQDASGKVSARCMANGLTVVSSSANDVVCELKMGAFNSALTQLLIGNSYSTPPKTLVKFNLAQMSNNTIVQANEWIETQMAFGQMRRQDLANDKVHNDLMAFLSSAGAQYLPGTSFPNNAYMGVAFKGSTKTKFKGKDTPGVVLGQVTAGAPIDVAGAKEGDLLVAVNDKPFANVMDFEKRTRDIPVGSKYDVTVERAGHPMTLSVVSARRPAVGGEVMQTTQLAGTPAPVAAVPQISVADEIMKLNALKEKGVITDAEFQAEKASLLKSK